MERLHAVGHKPLHAARHRSPGELLSGMQKADNFSKRWSKRVAPVVIFTGAVLLSEVKRQELMPGYSRSKVLLIDSAVGIAAGATALIRHITKQRAAARTAEDEHSSARKTELDSRTVVTEEIPTLPGLNNVPTLQQETVFLRQHYITGETSIELNSPTKEPQSGWIASLRPNNSGHLDSPPRTPFGVLTYTETPPQSTQPLYSRSTEL